MADKYKIGIVGGGAVGLTYAAFLAPVAQILIKTRRPQQAQKLQTAGLDFTLDGQVEHVSGLQASANPADLKDCDAVLVTVKSYDTVIIATELSTNLKADTPIVTLQNGLLSLPLLKERVANPQRVFGGVSYIGASRTNDHTIVLGRNRRTVIDEKAAVLVKVMQQTRFGVEASSDIKQTIWDKMALNVGQNALSAITDLSVGEMLDSKYCLDIASHLLAEFEDVAAAEGIHFNFSLMEKLQDNWKMSRFYPSMWQDLKAGHRTEIDAINGAISDLGRTNKVDTPYNDMLVALIKIKENTQ